MAARKSKQSEEEILEKAFAKAKDVLLEKSVVGGAGLGPPAVRARVIERLLAAGYEKGGATRVRVPLSKQADLLLVHGAHVPLMSLHKSVAGATPAEAKKLALALVSEGRAHLVLRGKQLSLVPITETALGQGALKPLIMDLQRALAWLKKAASDKIPVSVLKEDLDEAFAEALGRSRVSSTTTSESVEAVEKSESTNLGDEVRGALLALADEDSALVSLPLLVRRLLKGASVSVIHEELLRASQAGEIELRPEGGIGRLSEEDAKLCPLGAGGIPLSFARIRGQES